MPVPARPDKPTVHPGRSRRAAARRDTAAFLRIGPADHDKFLAVEAFDLEPQAAVTGRVRGIGAFRDDALELQLAGLLMERRALSAVVIAVVQGRRDTRQQFGEPQLALDQRPRANIVAV